MSALVLVPGVNGSVFGSNYRGIDSAYPMRCGKAPLRRPHCSRWRTPAEAERQVGPWTTVRSTVRVEFSGPPLSLFDAAFSGHCQLCTPWHNRTLLGSDAGSEELGERIAVGAIGQQVPHVTGLQDPKRFCLWHAAGKETVGLYRSKVIVGSPRSDTHPCAAPGLGRHGLTEVDGS